MQNLRFFSCLLFIFFLFVTCKRDSFKAQEGNFSPEKKIVIVLVDGPRYSETGGDTTHSLQPNMYSQLVSNGCVFTNFINSGETYTMAGHVSIFTGFNEPISNDGKSLPSFPGLGQLFLKRYKLPKQKVCILSSKDKLEVLSDCSLPGYKSKFKAFTDCGNFGLGSGYRDDSVTQQKALEIINANHPDFLFVQFKEPDVSGHSGNFANYKAGILSTDNYIAELWNKINTDDYYKNKTYFIVTNDHGRHLDGHLDGFISHGDSCSGCRHINLFVSGPGIKKNYMETNAFDQRDLNKTILELFNLNTRFSNGNCMTTIFEN